MLICPSIPAAAVAGAVVLPLFTYGARLIGHSLQNDLLQFLWCAIGVFITVAAIGDFRHIAEDWRKGRLFSWRSLARDFSEQRFERFVVPAWIRMGVWFASVVISSLLLKAVGLEF